ncbi:hypothetical protein DMENIID0001_112440 [Sergentomyia squamirostris]
MWPTIVDMTRDECRSVLRRLELEAYSSVISTFRAQGHLTEKKVGILKDLQGVLHISADRHRSEARRVAHDEELNTVATKIYGQTTTHEWSREGRRMFPFFPRSDVFTALTPAADAAADDATKHNSTLPYPSDTERIYKPLDTNTTVPVISEAETLPKPTSRKEAKRAGVCQLEIQPAVKKRIVQASSPGGRSKEVTVSKSPEKKQNSKKMKNIKWTSPKKSPMSDSEKSNLASRIMHSYASSGPIPVTLKRCVGELKSSVLEEMTKPLIIPQIATSKKDITTNLTKLTHLGATKAIVKKLENPTDLKNLYVPVSGGSNWCEEERPPKIPIAIHSSVKKITVPSTSIATLMTPNGGNIIKKMPSQNPPIVRTITTNVTKPKVKIISQQITPAPLTPGTQVKIPAGLHLKTLQGRPDNIKIVAGPQGKMVLKAVNEPMKAKVTPLKNVQTVVLPASLKAASSPNNTQPNNNLFKIIKESKIVNLCEPIENNVVVLDIQQEQSGVHGEEDAPYASQITEDTPVDILPANDVIIESAESNRSQRTTLRTIRVPKRPMSTKSTVTTDWEEELDTQTNHIRTRHKSGGELLDEEDSNVEFTYLADDAIEECDDDIEEDNVTLEDSSIEMMDDPIVEEPEEDYHENGQVEMIEEVNSENMIHSEEINGSTMSKISIESLITAGQILESKEMAALREQECGGDK